MKIIKTKIHKFKNKTTFTKTQTRETQIIQKKKKNRKMIEKSYHKNKKKNSHTENHQDLEINHEKIIKHLSHNLKY